MKIGDRVRITKSEWKGYEGEITYMDSRVIQVTVNGFDWPARVRRASVELI